MNRQIGQSTTILYVVFTLASNYYGIDIRDTYRVLRMDSLIRVPDAPPALKGTIDLQGQLIPVVDLSRRLGLQATRPTAESRIIVVNIAEQQIGLIVDSITGVLPVPLSSVEPVVTPTARTNYLWGIANLGIRQILLLDLDKVFSAFNGYIPAVPTIDRAPSAKLSKVQPASGADEGGQLTLKL
ncbi:MAG TPA: purine-binding chemotaxis protein CheW [Dehalococcoidia bacterium]|nr:purine-binding chemotaxis protein CheW [Dehalococcoidia bacterium]